MKDAKAFFTGFLDEMKRVAKKDAMMVFLTTHSGIFEEYVKHGKLKLVDKIKIVNSGLESEIVVLSKGLQIKSFV